MEGVIEQNRAFGALVPAQPVKYCLYARKSSESEEKQALSIDSQVKEMLAIAERDGLEIVDIRREAHSAKDCGQRSVFQEMIRDLRSGRYTGVLTWAPDRLSRNAGDLGTLVDLMDQKLLHEIRTYGQRFSNSPNEKFLLMILCSQAKLENDNKSINVKRGLRMRCEMGLWPAQAPTGYLNEKRTDRKGYVMVDPLRGPVIKQMFEKVAYEKWSCRKLYHWLKFELNFKSAYGNKNLTLSNVHLILQNTFYYGSYEYPRKSGNWYTGKHQPILGKELFDQVQAHLKRDRITRGETQEFAFTRLMTCGLCGSGITAERKYKKLAKGGSAEYVYYGCTRARDKNCKCGYLREGEIIKQLVAQIARVEFNKKEINEIFEEEQKRARKFLQSFYHSETFNQTPIDLNINSYATHILKMGSIQEIRHLMNLVTSSLKVKSKKLYVC